MANANLDKKYLRKKNKWLLNLILIAEANKKKQQQAHRHRHRSRHRRIANCNKLLKQL